MAAGAANPSVKWTLAEGGDQITASSYCGLTEDQTLYAHWQAKQYIDPSVFTFNPVTYEYNGEARTADYSLTGEVTSGFTIKYIAVGYEDQGYVSNPVDAGTYNAVVTRAGNTLYYAFEHTYENVLTINKVTATLEGSISNGWDTGHNCTVRLYPVYAKYTNGTKQSIQNAACTVTYTVDGVTTTTTGIPPVLLENSKEIVYGTAYTVTVTVSNLRNFNLTNSTLTFTVTWGP